MGTAASDSRVLLFYKYLLTLIRRLCWLHHIHHAPCYQQWISDCTTMLWFSLWYVKLFRLEKESYCFHSWCLQSLSDTCRNIHQRRLLSPAHRCHRFCRGLDDKALWTKAKTCERTDYLTSGDKASAPLCWSRSSIIYSMELFSTLPGSVLLQVTPVKPSEQIQVKESFPAVVTHVPPFWHTFTSQESPVNKEIKDYFIYFPGWRLSVNDSSDTICICAYSGLGKPFTCSL